MTAALPLTKPLLRFVRRNPDNALGDLVCDEEHLKDLCRNWQERLRLNDWQVHVKLARAHEMGGPNSSGECTPCPESKLADILVLDPIDFQPIGLAPYDHEEILVHELLHCHFAGLGMVHDSKENYILEQGIQSLTISLVAAYRKIEKYAEEEHLESDSSRKHRIEVLQHNPELRDQLAETLLDTAFKKATQEPGSPMNGRSDDTVYVEGAGAEG